MLWIPAYNKVLAVARDACAESTEKRRVDLREPEAWLHLAVHLAKHARVTAPDYALTAAVFDEAKDAIGKGRCRAINAASDFPRMTSLVSITTSMSLHRGAYLCARWRRLTRRS